MTPKAKQAHALSCEITKAHTKWLLSWITGLLTCALLMCTAERVMQFTLIIIIGGCFIAARVFRRKLSDAEDRMRRFNQGKGT